MSGVCGDENGKRWQITDLSISQTVRVGDRVPILYGDGPKEICPLEAITAVEPA